MSKYLTREKWRLYVDARESVRPAGLATHVTPERAAASRLPERFAGNRPASPDDKLVAKRAAPVPQAAGLPHSEGWHKVGGKWVRRIVPGKAPRPTGPREAVTPGGDPRNIAGATSTRPKGARWSGSAAIAREARGAAGDVTMTVLVGCEVVGGSVELRGLPQSPADSDWCGAKCEARRVAAVDAKRAWQRIAREMEKPMNHPDVLSACVAAGVQYYLADEVATRSKDRTDTDPTRKASGGAGKVGVKRVTMAGTVPLDTIPTEDRHRSNPMPPRAANPDSERVYPVIGRTGRVVLK